MAHGNGPNGLTVLETALVALGRLDQEHAVVYFQMVYDALREPMRRALEKLVMERQTESKATFPPFMQRLIDGSKLEGKLDGLREGKIEGELKGKRDVLLRFLRRAGIALTEDERARILTCEDAGLLDQWVDNVLGAKTAADVFS